MKLLFDQNLSRHLPQKLVDLFPESAHVREFGMQSADDQAIWSVAAERGFTIVSKDADYYQRSLVDAAPPKVIWIRVGNCTTAAIESLLRARAIEILHFEQDPSATFLALS